MQLSYSLSGVQGQCGHILITLLEVTILKGASKLQPNPSVCSSHTCLHLTELKANKYEDSFPGLFFLSPLDSFPILPIAQPCKLGVIDSHLFLGLRPGFLITLLPAEEVQVTFKWLLKQEYMLSAFSQGEGDINNWGDTYLPGRKLQCALILLGLGAAGWAASCGNSEFMRGKCWASQPGGESHLWMLS